MSTAASTVGSQPSTGRGARAVLAALQLHLNKREQTFVVPLGIAGMVAIVSVVISLLFWRGGSIPGTQEWISGSRANPGIAYALVGFIVYLGVQSVATTFPFALTLGATRRSFALGTLLWGAITSAYLAAVFSVLVTIELATDHWFAGFYIFDVHVLGAGELGRLIPIVFLTSLTLLVLGGVFGASWIRYGARGPQLIGVIIGAMVVVGLLIVIPSFASIMAAFELWWLAVAAVVVIVLASVGMWLLLRNATVR